VKKILILSLLFLGVALSIYAFSHDLELASSSGQTGALCNISQKINCDAVSASAYSKILGVPISALGILYFALLLISWLIAPRSNTAQRALSDLTLFAVTIGALGSLVLFAISWFLIGALCIVCIGVYLVIFALLGVLAREKTEEGFFERVRNGAVLVFTLSSSSPALRPTCIKIFILAIVGLAAAVYSGEILRVRAATSAAGSAIAPAQMLAANSKFIADWQAQPEVEIKLNLEPGPAVDYMKGPPQAAVRIVEFSDIQCPACRRAYSILESILADYSGSVQLVHKNYPLDNACNPLIKHKLHEHACYAAEYARCAGEQGQFWEALELLFTLDVFTAEKAPDLVRKDLLDSAKFIAVDREALERCLSDGSQRSAVIEDIRQGNELGVENTPSIWINNRKVSMPSEAALRAIVEFIVKSPAAPNK
jgi:protein-disulfide isomerase/uncharacterized membrane protein